MRRTLAATLAVVLAAVAGCTGEGGEPGPAALAVAPAPQRPAVVGYFTEWSVYARNFHVRDVQAAGSGAALSHLVYAFGSTEGGRCGMGDRFAATEKVYGAAQSVDGVADQPGQALRGTFNQLRKLKALNPRLKIVWSFGGWTGSAGLTDAARDPAAFAESCHGLLRDERWAGLFDGIDVDWEYPNACGLTCDTSGPDAFGALMRAVRARFGSDALVTAAITADGTDGGRIDATDYAAAAPVLNWLMPMTYDYHGNAADARGPTAAHSPLTAASAAIGKLRAKGVPADKLLLGIGFYGRGWTGVTRAEPGGPATGQAKGSYETGIEDYRVLKQACPPTGTTGGTAYAFCRGQWWSYDTPATITGKMTYAREQSLGGAFFWDLSGDTTDGELVTAIVAGLR